MNNQNENPAESHLPSNAELVEINKEITKKAAKSASITTELADELVIANVEVAHQKKEKGKRAAELLIANVEKAKSVAQLVIANKELLFQKQEKNKRAAELVALIIKLGLANKKATKSEAQLLSTLNALAMARDNETGKHIIRTQNYVKSLALRLRQMGHYVKQLDDKSIDLMFRAAPLHDIGKVAIPDKILHKPGPLTDKEREIMRSHPSIGIAVLRFSGKDSDRAMDVIEMAIQIAGGHHERWDGSGYPGSLKGESIPLAARIMSVADMYDALVSHRVYKNKWTSAEAAAEIVGCKGVNFDPIIVDAFIADQANFESIASEHQDDQL